MVDVFWSLVFEPHRECFSAAVRHSANNPRWPSITASCKSLILYRWQLYAGAVAATGNTDCKTKGRARPLDLRPLKQETHSVRQESGRTSPISGSKMERRRRDQHPTYHRSCMQDAASPRAS